MREYIKPYIRYCHTCSRIKPSQQAPYGSLQPVSISNCPWNELTMDYITGLPDSRGCNAILVVVDRLTKIAHFIPYQDSWFAEEVPITLAGIAYIIIKRKVYGFIG